MTKPAAQRRKAHYTSYRRYQARFIIAAIACCTLDLVLPPRFGLATAATIFLLFSSLLCYGEAQQSRFIINPTVCYFGWQALTLGISPLYVAITTPSGELVRFGSWSLALDRVAFGHAIMVCGAAALYLGMSKAAPVATKPVGLYHRATPSVTSLVVFGSLGMAVHVFRESVTDHAGSVIAAFSVLPLAVLSIIAVCPPNSLQHLRSVQLLLITIGCVILVALNARRDSKMDLMLSFVPIVWWLLTRGYTRVVLAVSLVGAVFYLVCVAPLVTAVRNSGTRNSDGIVSVYSPQVTEVIVDQLRADLESSPFDYITRGLDSTMMRLCDPIAAGMVTSIVDDDGYLYGRDAAYILAALVPRVFWPEKPIVDRGRDFTVRLGWAADRSTAITSTGQTVAGELFWNFGWGGVIVGMYLLGLAIAGIWWGAAGPDPSAGVVQMAAYVSAMLSFVPGTGSAAGPVFAGCISSGVVFRVAAYAMRIARGAAVSAPLARRSAQS